jgi:hypothetical protein
MIIGKKFNKVYCFLGGIFCLLAVFFIFSSSVKASNLYQAYDLINNSAPAALTNHDINFYTAQAVPPSGKIIITFADNGLNIPAGFDYLDLDLATAASGTNIFLDHQLASTSATSTDGVAVNDGLGGKITITLNSSSGIGAHDGVRIKLGNNAVFGGTGDKQIRNASSTGSYWLDVKTYDAANSLIDHVRTFLVMINPVKVSVGSAKIRANGLPTGTLTVGTVQTIMSLTTNYPAVCRYSTASGTDYYEMIDDFYTSDNIYHTTMISGLSNARCYSFFVRCYDNEVGDVNTDDYTIHFCIAAAGNGGTGGGQGGGTGNGTGGGTGGGNSGGGGGGGGGGNGSGSGSGSGVLKPYPIENVQLPSVALSGYAYPGSTISVLQDSQTLGTVLAKPDASFLAEIGSLKKGLYTFTLVAQDTEGIKSIAYPTTFWIEVNTQTNVSDILIPPTIKLASTTVSLGQNIIASGQSAPNQRVIVQMSDPNKKLVSTNKEKVSSDGRWISIFPTTGLTAGIYGLTAQTSYAKIGSSTLSEKVQCGLGQKLEQGPCSRSDINKDGKINLVDFSIMMFYWGTNNANADINQDGKVNLVDFSILMYCWTG